MTLDEARQNIGAGVVSFRGGASAEDEDGVITSVNDTYVFVRYAGRPVTEGHAARGPDLAGCGPMIRRLLALPAHVVAALVGIYLDRAARRLRDLDDRETP
jgi:hypothetical protein